MGNLLKNLNQDTQYEISIFCNGKDCEHEGITTVAALRKRLGGDHSLQDIKFRCGKCGSNKVLPILPYQVFSA